jgi:hypothetical protein
MLKTIRICYDSSGKKRVLIIRRDDGFYTFQEEHFSDDPFEMCWIVKTSNRSLSICETMETALTEAMGRIHWLSEIHHSQASNDDESI